ncbi:MAG: alpha/beta hydrolase [Spirochaetaceae bacterium]
MRLARIPRETTVNPYGRPLFFDGGEEAILILHGFTGRTGEMSYMATRLNERGYTVSVPRLPGHGTNGQDFLQSDADQWLRHTIDAYLELRRRYRRVYVAGLSMGGLLALLIASRFDPDGVALCAPALRVTRRSIVFSPVVGRFVTRWSTPYEPDAEDPLERELQLEYYAYEWVRPAGELYRLMRRARRAVRSVAAPTLTVVSAADELVPPEVADFVARRVPPTTRTHRVLLTESDHVIVNGTERERVAAEVASWFETTTADGRNP